MDKHHQDIFEWDVINWSKSLQVWEPALLRSNPRDALTIGERGGGLSLYLARKGIAVTCTDLNGVPESTVELHRECCVQNHLKYTEANVLDLPFPNESFDVVMCKSVIVALSTRANQLKALEQIHRVLRPSGQLLFAENLRGSPFHTWARRRFVQWSHSCRYLHWPQDKELFATFDTCVFRTYGFFGAFGRSERQRQFLGSIDVVAEKLVTPAMRYILAGRCVKPPD